MIVRQIYRGIMTKFLKVDENYTVVYTGTGQQEEIIFDISKGYPFGGTVIITGGSSDVFSVKTKTGNSYQTEIDSVDGKIPHLPIFSKGQGLLVDISSNISQAIKLEIIL